MADTPYTRSYSFAGFQNNQPAKPLPGQRVDIEFDNIARGFADLRALIAAGVGGGGLPGPVVDLPIAGLSLKANLLSSPAIPQVVSFDQFKAELGIGSGGGGGLPDWNDVQNKPAFGNAATRDVGTGSGTVAAGDDARLVGALQAANNGSDFLNKAVVRSNLGLKGAALLDVGTTAGTVAAGDAVAGKADKNNPTFTGTTFTTAAPPRITTAVLDQNGCVNLDSAGADLTGASSAHLAFQVCLDAVANKVTNGGFVGGTVRAPQGAKLKIDQQLNFTANGSINIHAGTGRNRLSATIYKNCPTLFNISGESYADGASNIGADIGGFLIYGEHSGGTAIRVANIQQAYVHDIRYASGSGYLDKFVEGKNLSGSYFDNIYARNDHGILGNNDIQGRMFDFTATYGATDNHFNDLGAQGWDTFWYAYNNSKPANEGHMFNKCSIVQCKSGLFWDAAPGFEYSPGIQFLNGHMNTYRDWVWAKNVSSVIIADSQFELSSVFGQTKIPLQLTNVLRFTLHDLFLYYSDSRNASCILVEGNSNQGLIHDIQGILNGSGQPAIVLQSGVKNTMLHHCGFYAGSGAIPFVDASGNNTNIIDSATLRIHTS